MQLRLLHRGLTLLLLVIGCGCSSRESIHYKIEHRYAVSDPQFHRSLGNLLGPPLVEGNTVASLMNGAEAFPVMLEAIRKAEKNINFETFIYWRGDVGSQFTDALVERARAGVKVHIVIDAIGSAQIDKSYFRKMTDAGAHVEHYHPVAWYNPSSAARLNNRTHRKLLIIDGRIGFTGGMGIGDEWSGNAEDKDHCGDMHYRVEGPVVLQLQSAFCDNWMKTTGEVLDGTDYFPEIKAGDGKLDAQVFKSDPFGGSESMQLMFLMSIAAATKDIRMGTAYFVPDGQTIDALRDARKRGVRVQILVPGPVLDQKIVRAASRARWGGMLEAGVEIYEFQPTMYHTKMMVVDQQWTSLGSANIDARSFKLNDEANLNVFNPDFAAEQAKIFDADLTRATPYTFEEWKKRSLFKRVTESLATLFAPLL